MTLLHRVRGLIERLAPEPICDDCIAGKLALPTRDQAEQMSRELAGTVGFERSKAACALCGKTRPAIRRR